MTLNTSSLTSKNITVANHDKPRLGNYTETTCCMSIIKIRNLNFIQNVTVDYGEWSARLRNCQKILIILVITLITLCLLNQAEVRTPRNIINIKRTVDEC